MLLYTLTHCLDVTFSAPIHCCSLLLHTGCLFMRRPVRQNYNLAVAAQMLHVVREITTQDSRSLYLRSLNEWRFAATPEEASSLLRHKSLTNGSDASALSLSCVLWLQQDSQPGHPHHKQPCACLLVTSEALMFQSLSGPSMVSCEGRGAQPVEDRTAEVPAQSQVSRYGSSQ